jgi:DNA/RNA-binding domain of Phe-tRNA-synthetase-like protein
MNEASVCTGSDAARGRIRVHPDIWTRYPEARIAVVYAFGLQNAASDDWSRAELHEACRRATQALGSDKAQSHPHIQAWRGVYQSFGAKPSKYLCSAEALIQRAIKDAPPQINRAVDFYNAISIANVLPVGGEDLDHLQGDLVLQFADGTLTFDVPDNGGAEPIVVPAGEVVWADAAGVTCRRWNWRQGRRTRLTEQSRNAYFVLEALCPPFVEGDFDRVIGEIADGLRERMGASCVVMDRLR